MQYEGPTLTTFYAVRVGNHNIILNEGSAATRVEGPALRRLTTIVGAPGLDFETWEPQQLSVPARPQARFSGRKNLIPATLSPPILSASRGGAPPPAMKRKPVNPAPAVASTRVMAAGTVMKPMDAEAAQELAAGEFARVVATHRPQIFRFLLASTRDYDLAETLTQECFLKAHRNWAGFRGESTAMTWLIRIAINLEKDHWRNRRLQFWRRAQVNSVDVDEAGEWLPSGERTAEQQLLAREQVARVWNAVEGLSERQRTVFLLRYVEEMELSEIAAATALSEGTVKAHLSRALGKVRAEVRGRQ